MFAHRVHLEKARADPEQLGVKLRVLARELVCPFVVGAFFVFDAQVHVLLCEAVCQFHAQATVWEGGGIVFGQNVLVAKVVRLPCGSVSACLSWVEVSDELGVVDVPK